MKILGFVALGLWFVTIGVLFAVKWFDRPTSVEWAAPPEPPRRVDEHGFYQPSCCTGMGDDNNVAGVWRS